MITKTTDGREVKITAHLKFLQPSAIDKDNCESGLGLLELISSTSGSSRPQQEELLFHAFEEMFTHSAGGVTVLLPEVRALIPGQGTGQKNTPALGSRGIRACLAHPEAYRPFLRAVLRAGADGCFELALPMVGHVSEIVRFKEMLRTLKSELAEEGKICTSPAVGIMLEVPAVIPSIDTMIWESGFFIVGDLFLRYLMADDRLPGQEDDPVPFYQRAFLLQAGTLVTSLSKRKAGARIAASLVQDPPAIPLLVGLGFDEIVAPPDLIPGIVQIVRSLNYRSAQMLAAKATAFWDPSEARAYAAEMLPRITHQSK